MQGKVNDNTIVPAVVDAPVQDGVEEASACSSTSLVAENVPVSQAKTARGDSRRRWLSHSPGVVLLLGAGCLAANLVKAFRRQQREISEACRQLKSAQERLIAKEHTLEQAEARRKLDQEFRVIELTQQVADAQRELATVREMCRQATTKLEQNMSDLSVTETELRAARTQLQTASRDLALTHAHLEAMEGELGLSRSQNELMKREVELLRRQLLEAGQQLEGYIMVSRGRKNAQHDHEDDIRIGRVDYDDDLAAAATAGWGY